MKYLKFNFLIIVSAFCFTMTSCGDDVDCDEMSELNTLTNQWVDANILFSMEPTDENCDALRDITEDLLDLAPDFRDCVPVEEQAEFDSDLETIQENLDDLECG